MSSATVRARLEAATPAVETREWLRRRIRQDADDLELALDVVEAAKRLVACLVPMTDEIDELTELRYEINRWEAGT